MTALDRGQTPKTRPTPHNRTALVAALDIGTSKIACMIARLRPCPPSEALHGRSHAVELIGYSQIRSRGVKAGAVIDLAECEQAVRQAVAAAEKMAKVQVESVLVSVSAGRLNGQLIEVATEIRGGAVTAEDASRLTSTGMHHATGAGRTVLHALPVGYALDGVSGIRDPRGMLARSFGVDMNVVTADATVAKNLMLAVERCHLNVEAMAAAPYVASLSVLTGDEADIGAAVIEMGAGTTTLAVVSGGRFVHASGFAVGGQHITMDLARGLSTTLAEAERIKTLYGSAMGGPSDDRDMVTVPQLDEAESAPHIVPRSILTSIIKPRAEEILEMVRDRLQASPFAGDPRGRIVLAGGASQLTGLAELASRILGRSVRLGRPLGVSGLAEQSKGPAFAAAAGLLVYPQTAHLERFEARRAGQLMTGTDGYFSRVGRWLRESF